MQLNTTRWQIKKLTCRVFSSFRSNSLDISLNFLSVIKTSYNFSQILKPTVVISIFCKQNHTKVYSYFASTCASN